MSHIQQSKPQLQFKITTCRLFLRESTQRYLMFTLGKLRSACFSRGGKFLADFYEFNEVEL